MNNKVQEVLQYSREDIFVKEHVSIASASRETEYTIRKFIKGGCCPKEYKYIWKAKNPEKSEEYSKKFRSKA